MIVADILSVCLVGGVIYLTMFVLSRFFGGSHAQRMQMLILVVAAMLGTFMLLLSNQYPSLQTFAIVFSIILGFGVACIIVAIEIRRQRRLSDRNSNR